MKTSKLLKKIRTYIDSDQKKKKNQTGNIKTLLKKLKQKYRAKKAELEKENDAKKRMQGAFSTA